MNIINGSDVNEIYSKITMGKNEYNIIEKQETPIIFWYIIILSLIKYPNFANSCNVKYDKNKNSINWIFK